MLIVSAIAGMTGRERKGMERCRREGGQLLNEPVQGGRKTRHRYISDDVLGDETTDKRNSPKHVRLPLKQGVASRAR